MERVGDVFTELAEVVRIHSPALICVEGWNYQSERSQGPQGLWISRLIERLEARIALPFLELTTVTIKRCLGVRSKDEVRRALMARGYRLPVPTGKRVVPDHEWDALAVAVVGARSVTFREQFWGPNVR